MSRQPACSFGCQGRGVWRVSYGFARCVWLGAGVPSRQPQPATWFATTPTVRPSTRPKPQMMFLAQSGMISNRIRSSSIGLITSYLSRSPRVRRQSASVYGWRPGRTRVRQRSGKREGEGEEGEEGEEGSHVVR
jgi:hypothetical protein